jgi:glycosyltransferase involved in cell wall biosynthesis
MVSPEESLAIDEIVAGVVDDILSPDGDEPFVSFVVPSLGRETLERSLRSLDAQTDRAFRAVLVADGFVPPGSLSARFPWLSLVSTGGRLGRANHAGAVRNIGIEMASTEWVAFLDDDDTLSPRYVEWLRAEIRRSPVADAIVFRMRTDKTGPRHKVLPPPHATDFSVGYVGISFAARRVPRFFGAPLCPPGERRVLSFRPGATEDFDLLDRLREAARDGAEIGEKKGFSGGVVLAPQVAYFVEMGPEQEP